MVIDEDDDDDGDHAHLKAAAYVMNRSRTFLRISWVEKNETDTETGASGDGAIESFRRYHPELEYLEGVS